MGYYIQPTLIKGRNDMRSFQEEIFGPVIGVTTFKDEAEALEIANQTQFGLGAGRLGPATAIWRTEWGVGLKPVASGPTVITSTRPMPRLAAINSRALAAKPIKWPLMPINRRKTCW
ncbi:Acetaldehyde dehydrogenase 2 [Raoultella planticola]|uniref:Acetaldehyde dehydrogenase 2 n=1 Tax=Raoultella planticola TaxID=575 RepID=A0A485C8T5_RAOPL|nr:Acetaldehyde dehydrogenase 2 [Raoultella planticola]